jgi:surface protein
MFRGASSFNQPVTNFDTSKVTSMHGMFNGATSFNQNIYDWQVGQVTDFAYIFNTATGTMSMREDYRPCKFQDDPGNCKVPPTIAPTNTPTATPTATPTLKKGMVYLKSGGQRRCRDGTEPDYNRQTCTPCMGGYAGKNGTCAPCKRNEVPDALAAECEVVPETPIW